MTLLESLPRQAPQYRWRDDDDERALRMWTDGKSAAEISETLGVKSRSAVLGRIHRLRKANEVPERVTVPLHGKRKRDDAIALEEIPPVVIDETDLGPVEISVLDLTDHTCKFPMTERSPHTFCGAEPHGKAPYCQKHCRIAYQPPEAKAMPIAQRNRWNGKF